MVIFEVARSCALPAARGLRPQAPAVLPRLCQQGAGGRGSRHPAEHTRPTGTAGSVGHAALPEETKASVAAGGKGGGESPDPSVSASLPGRAPTLGLQQGVLPGRRPSFGPWKATTAGQNRILCGKARVRTSSGPEASRSGACEAQGQQASVQAQDAHL